MMISKSDLGTFFHKDTILFKLLGHKGVIDIDFSKIALLQIDIFSIPNIAHQLWNWAVPEGKIKWMIFSHIILTNHIIY